MRFVTRNPRKHYRTYPAILFSVVLLPRASTAPTTNSQPKLVTLEEALDYALQHYPAVRA